MLICQFEDGGKAPLRHVTVGNICLSKDEKQILLVKRATHMTNPDKYALPGGYLDINETIAEGALRELKEETGYTGKLIELFRIVDNPNRPQEDRQNVDFIFITEVGEKIGDSDHEIQEVKWFDLDALPPKEEFAFDHFEDIQLYIQHLNNPISLPIFSIHTSFPPESGNPVF